MGRETRHMGMGLTGRTLGIVGLGNIGRELARMAEPFGLGALPTIPMPGRRTVRRSALSCWGWTTCSAPRTSVRLLRVDPGDPSPHQRRALALMKPTGYLINVARGPIVDQKALTLRFATGVFRVPASMSSSKNRWTPTIRS